MSRHGLWLWLLATCAAFVAVTAHAVTVQAEGQIAHPGRLSLPEGSRLSAAAVAAAPTAQAYLLGAAFLRPSQLQAQRRLKAGLVYELGVLEGGARLDGDAELLHVSQRALSQVRAMPVTGRVPAQLDPRPAEVAPKNPLLAAGDRLVYPSRPRTVRIMGAVRQPCTVPHTAMRPARDYAAHCAPLEAASGDWIYVVEPDGRVFKRGIGAWNRQAAWYLAPGAIVWVPFKATVLAAAHVPDLNTDMAQFLATQPLGGERP